MSRVSSEFFKLNQEEQMPLFHFKMAQEQKRYGLFPYRLCYRKKKKGRFCVFY